MSFICVERRTTAVQFHQDPRRVETANRLCDLPALPGITLSQRSVGLGSVPSSSNTTALQPGWISFLSKRDC